MASFIILLFSRQRKLLNEPQTAYTRRTIPDLPPKKVGKNQKEIADELTRSPSSISRELKRNKGLKGYRPKQANDFAEQRPKSSIKARKLTSKVTSLIDKLLNDDFSPKLVL